MRFTIDEYSLIYLSHQGGGTLNFEGQAELYDQLNNVLTKLKGYSVMTIWH